jgi:hypothetical protein
MIVEAVEAVAVAPRFFALLTKRSYGALMVDRKEKGMESTAESRVLGIPVSHITGHECTSK